MNPTLNLLQKQAHGILKVAATLHAPMIRRATCQEQMPVIQIAEAGVMVELEFADDEGLVDFVNQLVAQVNPRGGRRRG